MTNEQMFLELVERCYDYRAAGDKAGLRSVLSPDATYAMPMSARASGMPQGVVDAFDAISLLIDEFTFHAYDRLDHVVQADRAAIRRRIRLTRKPDGPTVETEIVDLWTRGPDGKLASLVQFVDTALLLDLIESPARNH
jgi:ketosteroid isomerase-like protein